MSFPTPTFTKAFVTGASGFLGSKLVAHLLRSGVQVLALSRSEEADKKILEMGEIKIIRGM